MTVSAEYEWDEPKEKVRMRTMTRRVRPTEKYLTTSIRCEYE
jgi:hypothetical protein